MNALVVLNLNNFMPQKVRDSFEHAAMRWGCWYEEITEPLGPMHIFWQKTAIPLNGHVARFDRVLQLDADMLIRFDCPNIFDLVPEENIGVVSEWQPGMHLQRLHSKKDRWAKELGVTCYEDERHHLNAGLILYSPTRHKELLTEWNAIGKRSDWSTECPIPEQFALSCLLQSTHAPVTWLRWWYNTIFILYRRKRWMGAGIMRTYVYHFNGLQKLAWQEQLEQVEWMLL